jgi:hypothetical protein
MIVVSRLLTFEAERSDTFGDADLETQHNERCSGGP